jgi:hypothetical protein
MALLLTHRCQWCQWCKADILARPHPQIVAHCSTVAVVVVVVVAAFVVALVALDRCLARLPLLLGVPRFV